jgi:putative spermidine/putrescine transport system substrate-binding protein
MNGNGNDSGEDMKTSRAALISIASVVVSVATSFTVNAAEITVMGYIGAFADNYKAAVVEPFQAEHSDIKVAYYGVVNSAAALANMRAQKEAPQVNAVIFDLSVAKIAKEEGLVRETDLSKIPNYANLADIGKELGGYAAPLTYDMFVLLYNAKAFPEKPTSWEALWNKTQNGKIIIPAQGGSDIQAVLLTIVANRLAGENDYAKTIQPGVDRLVKLAPLVQTWEPKPDAYVLVANGTATLSTGYNARAQFYSDQTDGRIGSVGPVEGTASQINVISAVANSPNQEATETFINYALDPVVQARFAKKMFYAPSNTKATLDEATAKRIPFMDPEQRKKLIAVDWMKIGDIRTSLLEPWRRQILPAGR